MTREKSLFDESDPAAEAAADARADADVKAGRLVGHDAVRRWIASWEPTSRLRDLKLERQLRSAG